MDKIRVVTSSPEDVAVLERIARATFSDTFAAGSSAQDMELYLDTAYAPEVLAAEIDNPNSEVFFYTVEGEVAAYLKVNVGDAQTEPMSEDFAELQRIYVLPEYKRRGIGKTLLEHACEWARKQGRRRLWLGVWEHNIAAQDFYFAHGFERIGEHTFLLGSEETTDWMLAVDL